MLFKFNEYHFIEKCIIFVLFLGLSVNLADSSSHLAIPGSERIIQHDDPAFFRLRTAEGREIYILGSPHFVPINELLLPSALGEIKRLARERAILYTEHEVTNEVSITYLERPENCISKDLIDLGFNFFSFLSMSEEAREIERSPERLLLRLDESRSDLTLLDVARAELWLGAVILGTHAGILSYNSVGGTEHELLVGELSESWGSKLYLETIPESIDILKAYSKKTADDANNSNWAQRSIEKILKFNRNRAAAISEIRDKNFEIIRNYSWKIITGESRYLPLSCIQRNKLWVDVVATKLSESSSEALTPLLVVVGSGHLAGFGDKCSFIYFLMKRLGIKELERFKNTGEWIVSIRAYA